MGWPFNVNGDDIDPNAETFVRNKYKELKDFAESSKWLKLEETLEDDDHYPGVAYLTQFGFIVHFFMDKNSCEIETARSVSIKLPKSEGKEIRGRLLGGG